MIKSPINYVGSKYNILQQLDPLFPPADCFIDLFTGGGSVYMNLLNRYEKIIVNDILKDLIEIHKNLKNKSFILSAKNKSVETIENQQKYNELRSEYNKSRNPSDLLALIWSCNTGMMRFNKSNDFNQTWGKRGFNSSKMKIYKEYYDKCDVSHVEFISIDFDKIEIPKNSFIYMDPPYSNTGAGYNTTWGTKDDSRLIKFIELLINSNIKFGLSGTENNKTNIVYDFCLTQKLKCFRFGDLYKKVSKIDKINNEYYFYN